MENILFIGIGKLGLCFALCMEKAGYNVLGIDINEDYVNNLNNKKYKSFEPYIEKYLTESKNFKASTNLEENIHFSNNIFIMVNTPETDKNYYDSFILDSILTKISELSKETPKHIIISCTVSPNYITNTGYKILNKYNNIHNITYNPEIVRIGKIIYDIENNHHPIIIGTNDKEKGVFVENIYRNIYKYSNINKEFSFCHMTHANAEITKLATNCFKMMKITFANMIGDLCDRTNNTDANIIMEALNKDKLIKYGCFIPGYGYGGPCYPRDCKEFCKVFEKNKIDSIILQSVDKYNDLHAKYMAEIKSNLDDPIIFEKVAYREDCDLPIIDKSQKLKVAEYLTKKNKKVIIKDKENVINLVKKEYGNIFTYEVYNL